MRTNNRSMRHQTQSNFLKTSKCNRRLNWQESHKKGVIENLLRRRIAHLLPRSSRICPQPQQTMLKSKVWAVSLSSGNSKRKKRLRFYSDKLKSSVSIINSLWMQISATWGTPSLVSSSQSVLRMTHRDHTRLCQSLSISWLRKEVKYTVRNLSKLSSNSARKRTLFAHSNQNFSTSQGLDHMHRLSQQRVRKWWWPLAHRWISQMVWLRVRIEELLTRPWRVIQMVKVRMDHQDKMIFNGSIRSELEIYEHKTLQN